jgi:hypothetical protein
MLGLTNLTPSYRNYSITNKNDEDHIRNGRCPNYALEWQPISNRPHWPNGHNYFMGNGENIDDGSKELREALSKRLSEGIDSRHIVFCDLDGVLADFEQGVKNKFNKNVDEMNFGTMWGVINKSNTFFETLPWMPRGKELWSRIEQYNPIILTGVPRGNSSATQQKIRWCQRELGPNVHVITCATKDKPRYCMMNSVLIDDRTENLHAWNKLGGKFVLYHEDNLESIVERIDRHMETDIPSP